MTKYFSKLSEIAALWNDVESRAKVGEQFRQETIIAAINEMRYAGRRIVDVLVALKANNWQFNEKIKENLVVAHNYLINADHDVTDGICFFAHKRITKTISVHGEKKVKKLCPEFEQLRAEMLEAQKVISGSRKDRTKRIDNYRELAENYVPRVIELHDKMRGIPELAIADDLLAQVSILQRNVQTVTWIALFGSVASIVALFISIYQLIW